MEELVPWVLGLLVGIAYRRPPSGLGRRAAFFLLIIILGSGVTILNGEWSEDPGYALIDIGQTWLAATIAMFARRQLVLWAPHWLSGTTEG